METARQLLFFFSALGAFNGFLLNGYFAYTDKVKKPARYFLAALLLALSVRITKSVFLYFNRELSVEFIQLGLSALTFIGPLLYLYLSRVEVKQTKKNLPAGGSTFCLFWRFSSTSTGLTITITIEECGGISSMPPIANG